VHSFSLRMYQKSFGGRAGHICVLLGGGSLLRSLIRKHYAGAPRASLHLSFANCTVDGVSNDFIAGLYVAGFWGEKNEKERKGEKVQEGKGVRRGKGR